MPRLLIIVLLLLPALRLAHSAGTDELLEPDKAFRFSARAIDAQTVEVRYAIADGYYLYRDRFKFAAEPAEVTLGAAQFPKGEIHEDKFFGKQETYRGQLRIRLPIQAAGVDRVKLAVTSQGCADIGVCYVPQVQNAELLLASTGGAGSAFFAGGAIALDQPVLVGVLNVTPDSFSDGGTIAGVDDALRHAERLRADGAHLIDVGGESTRPGAAGVPAAEEAARVVPVVAALVAKGLGPVSVDTRKVDVARAALGAGAAAVNDVSGLAHDPGLAGAVHDAGAGIILMHMRGTPDTMDALASYTHVALEVADELRLAADRALGAGIDADRIALDPGFGFAKTAAQNLRLLDELATVVGLGYPVVVGPSRKRFLGAATGRPVTDRDRATAVACALAWERGARLFRVHDVALTREALALAGAVTGP